MMISSEDYWQFSCNLYSYQEVADTCLYWQDEYKVNVNLLLLAAYLQAKELQLQDPQMMLASIEEWQEQVQLPLRNIRKYCKNIGDPVYQQAKKLELVCEKVEQQKLFAVIPESPNKLLAEDNNIQLIQQYYQLPKNKRFEQFLISIKAFHRANLKA